MYRKYGQTFKILIAASVIAGVVGLGQFKVKAISVNELYANAYSATINAMNIKNQKSINQARIAIEALRGTDASFAIGEFSKQVDQVQHPFLVNIVNAINKAEETFSQMDINAARAAIDEDLPQLWKNSYSSAIDLIQQELMSQLENVYNAAVMSRLPEFKQAVYNLISELKLSSNPLIGNWAEEITKPMAAVWKESGINDTDDVVNYINENVNSGAYPITKLSDEDNKVYREAYTDSSKAVKNIWNDDGTTTLDIFYSEDKTIFIEETVLTEEGWIYINNVYFKDGKFTKFIAKKLWNDIMVDVKVYDESNISGELKSKLSIYEKSSQEQLTEAKSKITQ